ncbi:MAG: murein biosynthesis integral membrane protein MurJ [Methylococcaceae bacterium]|nr:murein biosynthesis integral membrane protein MurJ [Methylococcaceae bacterium]
MSVSRFLIRSTAIVSGMTLVSRILGFVRDMIFARVFGADSGTDAFFVAFKIPNFLRRLFAEGAFSQAFVPVLSDYREKGTREALKDFIDRTAGSLALILIAVTAVGVIAAPLLIWLFAPGFAWNGTRYELSVEMLRITFPYLFFISSTAFAGSVLNVFGRFALPAVTPVLLNISLIVAASWLAPRMDEPVLALAWGVFVAGALQLAIQFPALQRLGLLPRLKTGFHDPGVRRIVGLMVPGIFGVSVTQINLLFNTLIASFLVSGSISWLYYSDRLVEFPLGLFAIALATVILPALSKNHVQNDRGSFSESLDWGLRWVVLIGLPATLGLFILAEPVLAALFQNDEFSRTDVVMAGKSLKAYSIGLLAFMLVKVLVPGFSSRQDMKTPVRYGVYSVLANLALSVGLVFWWAHAGLALATSLAAFLNAFLLLRKLLQDRAFVPMAGWRSFAGRVFIANVAMGAVLCSSHHFTDWSARNAIGRLADLGLWMAAGGGVYVAALLLSGLRTSHLALGKTIH